MNVNQPFKVDGWTVFKSHLSSSSGWPIWLLMGIGTIFVVVGCFSDLRYLAVGLMVCIAVVPGIAALMYFYHTLSPQVIGNMVPHTVERTGEGYVLRVWKRDEPEDEETDEETQDERWVEVSVIVLPDVKIVRRKTSFEYDLFYFKDSPLKILYVPRIKNNENIKEYQP